MNDLSDHYNPICAVCCFSYLFCVMALWEWEFMTDDDPWKVSALVSAVMELFLSILLLLSAAITFFTTRFANICGLEPPCTYIRCSHPLRNESLGRQMLRTPPSWKTKDLRGGDFCPDCHPSRVHSKSLANIQEKGSDAFESNDLNVEEQDVVSSNGVDGQSHERRCFHSESSRNMRRGAKRTTFIHTVSTGNLKKDDNPLPLSRSGSESSVGFYGRHHTEISQAQADSDVEWSWQGTYLDRGKNIDSYEMLAHDREAQRRGVSEDVNEKSHGRSPSLQKGSQEESAEILPLYDVKNEVEELMVSNYNCEHCKKEDDGLVNIDSRLVQGTFFNDSELEKRTWQSRFLMSKDLLKPIDQKVDDNDCLQKQLVAVHSSSLEWNSQEAIVEGLQQASLDGADAPGKKNTRVLEGEQGGLLIQYPSKRVKLVSDDCIAVKDEHAFTNPLAKFGGSSEHVEDLALSKENEKEISTNGKQLEVFDSFKLAFQDERSVLAALEAELENERNAAAVATSEALAMISRLQEEKSAMQVRVVQLQRTAEEKAEYDEQAMGLLKEIIYKREVENIALEKEVKLYRETLSNELYKKSWLHEEIENSLPQSFVPLLLTGGEEVLSPIEDERHELGSAFPERGFQLGISSPPWIRQHGPGPELADLKAFSLDQSVNKASREFPMSDMGADMSVRAWDEEGRLKYHSEADLYGPHCDFEQLKESGRSIFSRNDEESLSSIAEHLWVLEEGLQKLHGKGSEVGQSKACGAQQLAGSPTHGREDKSLNGTWGGQNGCGIESKEQRDEVEMDGIAEGFVPIHDVYEVQSSSYQSPPFAEERDAPEGFEGISGNSEVPTGGTPESLSQASMAKHRILSPRFSPAKKVFLSDEAPSTPIFMPPAAGWFVGKSFYPEGIWDQQDSQARSMVRREERGTMREGIQQLEVRLKMLEEDREVRRESLESLTHRDEELNLLREIARHLAELHMAGSMNVSEGVSSSKPELLCQEVAALRRLRASTDASAISEEGLSDLEFGNYKSC